MSSFTTSQRDPPCGLHRRGFNAALAATIDPPAIAFLLPLILVIGALRWPVRMRTAGVLAYAPDAVAPCCACTIGQGPSPAICARERFIPNWRWATHASYRVPWISGSLRLFRLCRIGVRSPRPLPLTLPLLADSMFSTTTNRIRVGSHFSDGSWRVLASFLGKPRRIQPFSDRLLRHPWRHPHHAPPLACRHQNAGRRTLGGALAVIVIYSLCRSDTRNAMFATRWFVVFLPLTLFWAGAWLRRPHRRSSWIAAAALLAFSITASLIVRHRAASAQRIQPLHGRRRLAKSHPSSAVAARASFTHCRSRRTGSVLGINRMIHP